jgi:rhodanese-related sulfurtransferase
VKRFELAIYVAAIAVLSVALFLEGRHTTELASRSSVSPKQVMAMLSNPQLKVQVVDLRPVSGDEGFDESHIPGALPMPGCDEAQTPASARERIYPYVTTILVSGEGDQALFEKCAAKFGVARNLAGGFTAWDDATLPEDSGSYSPPKNAAGGGCL